MGIVSPKTGTPHGRTTTQQAEIGHSRSLFLQRRRQKLCKFSLITKALPLSVLEYCNDQRIEVVKAWE